MTPAGPGQEVLEGNTPGDAGGRKGLEGAA